MTMPTKPAITFIPSPNFYRGRAGYTPRAIVIHIAETKGDTTAENKAGLRSWFRNKDSEVSSHYAVYRDGSIDQFVQDTDSAWGNGPVKKPSWTGLIAGVNPNYYTISIEHEGKTGEAWTGALYASDVQLVAYLCAIHGIPADRKHIIGHYEINRVDKSGCPGTGIDLDRLARDVQAVLAGAQKPPAEDWHTKYIELFGVADGIYRKTLEYIRDHPDMPPDEIENRARLALGGSIEAWK